MFCPIVIAILGNIGRSFSFDRYWSDLLIPMDLITNSLKGELNLLQIFFVPIDLFISPKAVLGGIW